MQNIARKLLTLSLSMKYEQLDTLQNVLISQKVILFKNINMKENSSQGAIEGYIKLFGVVETFTP